MVTQTKAPDYLPIGYYELEIRKLYPLLIEYPESETLHGQMYELTSKWADLVQIKIFRSPEEKYPWTEEELGYPVFKMETKAECGVEQTGDYIAYYQGSGYEGWIPFLVERKGGRRKIGGNPEDLYSTLSDRHSRKTFYNEIGRFRRDIRFSRMLLIAECSMSDYCKYYPQWNGKKRNTNHTGMNVPAREATIAGLFARDCIVVFMDSRPRAITFYRNIIRMWLMRNYAQILGLKQQA